MSDKLQVELSLSTLHALIELTVPYGDCYDSDEQKRLTAAKEELVDQVLEVTGSESNKESRALKILTDAIKIIS